MEKKKPCILAAFIMLAAFFAQQPVKAQVDIQAGLPTLNVNTTPVTLVGFGGKQWSVIGYNGSGVASVSGALTLLCNDEWDTAVFAFCIPFNTALNNEYSGSVLQGYMNTKYNGLSSKEQALVVGRTLPGGGAILDPDNIAGPAVVDAKFWPLSVNEAYATEYELLRFVGSDWWLRTPGVLSGIVARVIVNSGISGSIYIEESGIWSNMEIAPRPATQLDLSSVLYTSSANGTGSKASATTGGGLVGAVAPTGALKFTMEDSGMATPVLTLAGSRNGTANISFEYSGATTGIDQYISCTLEQSGNVVYYGKLASCASATYGNFILPISGISAGNYTLNIFCEQANGDNYSDFAGTPLSVTLTVNGSGNGTISGTGFTIVTTVPTLTAGAVNRTSNQNATVEFTSDKTGEYYYDVVASGASAPFINTSGAGIACGTSATTIALTTLTAGAKDIYIVAKDAIGNVSSPLIITIPGYASPPTPPVTVTTAGISGPTSMTLTEGYAATSTNAFTVTGTGVSVTVTSGNALIAWNNATKQLNIAEGLPAGNYPVTLRAANNSSSSTFTFTLTVEKRAYYLQWNQIFTGGSVIVRTNNANPYLSAEGDEVTITVTPDEGRELHDIYVYMLDNAMHINTNVIIPLSSAPGTRSTLRSGTSQTFTFTMPAHHVAIVATFTTATGNEQLIANNEQLKAYAENGVLYVSGLQADRTLSVYNAMGILIHVGAESARHAYPLPGRGVYIVTDGKTTVKVVY